MTVKATLTYERIGEALVDHARACIASELDNATHRPEDEWQGPLVTDALPPGVQYLDHDAGFEGPLSAWLARVVQ